VAQLGAPVVASSGVPDNDDELEEMLGLLGV
jgi:hypothetical protein